MAHGACCHVQLMALIALMQLIALVMTSWTLRDV
jgi:hypothetical protein